MFIFKGKIGYDSRLTLNIMNANGALDTIVVSGWMLELGVNNIYYVATDGRIWRYDRSCKIGCRVANRDEREYALSTLIALGIQVM